MPYRPTSHTRGADRRVAFRMTMDDTSQTGARIKVIGVGGGGGTR